MVTPTGYAPVLLATLCVSARSLSPATAGLRLVGRAGIGDNTHRKRRRQPMPAPHEDRVQRRFIADGRDRLWCTDVIEHATGTGTVYCCAVLRVFSHACS